MSKPRYTFLVLAATRGNQDPLAKAGGVSHKAFINVGGMPMLQRVVQTVFETGYADRVIVSIEAASTDEARKLLDPLGMGDRIIYTPSRDKLGPSVAAVAEEYPDARPLVITTGDNALHTPEIVSFFCAALAGIREDCAIGFAPAEYILKKYPEGNRAFHWFRDGAFSSCNLYALLTPRAVAATSVFNTGGQFGKNPKRLIGAIGLFGFLLYKSRLVKLRTFLAVVSRGLGITAAPILMPFAEGPIDIDRMQDWELAEKIWEERKRSGQANQPAPAS